VADRRQAAWGALSSGGFGSREGCRACSRLAPRCARCSRWRAKGTTAENGAGVRSAGWPNAAVAKAREKCSNRGEPIHRSLAQGVPQLRLHRWRQARHAPVQRMRVHLMIWKSSAVTSSATKEGDREASPTRCRPATTGQRGDRLRRPCRWLVRRHVERRSQGGARIGQARCATPSFSRCRSRAP